MMFQKYLLAVLTAITISACYATVGAYLDVREFKKKVPKLDKTHKLVCLMAIEQGVSNLKIKEYCL